MSQRDDSLREVRNAELSGENIENSAEVSRVGLRASKRVDELVAMLIQVERLIVFTDRALRIAQPPINGKIGIRWWRPRGGNVMRMPVLVTWHRHRGKRWRARELAQVRRDRITREGTAALCADHAYTLARTAVRLIACYKSMVVELERVLRQATRAAAGFGKINLLEAQVIHEHQAVVDALTRAGYEVDAKTRGLADKYVE